MVKVQIAGVEQELSALSKSWLHEQIRNRQRDGVQVCVRVFVQTPEIDIVLSSGECPRGPGGGRAPKLEEKRIFDIWDQMELNTAPVHSGKLVAFLNRIKELD